jgi:hypothetical protein
LERGSFTLGPAEEFEANLVRIFEDCEHLNAASGELFRSVRPYRRARCLEASRKFGERRFVRDLEAKIGDVVRLALVKSNALRLIIVAKRNRPIHGWRTDFHPEHASGKSNPVTWLANFEAEIAKSGDRTHRQPLPRHRRAMLIAGTISLACLNRLEADIDWSLRGDTMQRVALVFSGA